MIRFPKGNLDRDDSGGSPHNTRPAPHLAPPMAPGYTFRRMNLKIHAWLWQSACMRIVNIAKQFGAALTSAVLAVAAAPAPASAAEIVTCVLNETITWDPPLKNEPQPVTFTTNGQLTACNGLSATATYHQTGTYPSASCTSLLTTATGTRVWDWTAPGVESSVFAYQIVVQRVLGNLVVVATGPIVAGAYTDSAVRTVGASVASELLGCAGQGVSRVISIGTVTIGV